MQQSFVLVHSFQRWGWGVGEYFMLFLNVFILLYKHKISLYWRISFHCVWFFLQDQNNWSPSSVTAIQPQSSVPRSRLQAWGDESEKNSDKESMGDLSASSVSSLVPSVPPNQEQMMSIAQLVKYLHSLTVSCS